MNLQGLRAVTADVRFPTLVSGTPVALKATPRVRIGEVESMHTDDYMLLVKIRADAGFNKYALAEMLVPHHSHQPQQASK
jgi:hypothetical protein